MNAIEKPLTAEFDKLQKFKRLKNQEVDNNSMESKAWHVSMVSSQWRSSSSDPNSIMRGENKHYKKAAHWLTKQSSLTISYMNMESIRSVMEENSLQQQCLMLGKYLAVITSLWTTISKSNSKNHTGFTQPQEKLATSPQE